MPSYVYNEVTIRGEEEQIYHLEKFVSSHDRVFDFSKVIPIKQNKAHYLEPATPKWGTKWNAVEPKISHRCENSICYEFDTAWDPPFQIFCELTHRFPGLSLDWSWCGTDRPDYFGEFRHEHYLKALEFLISPGSDSNGR